MIAIPNKVIIGDEAAPILTFENNAIESLTEETGVSPIGDELFIDQFLPIVKYHLLIRYRIVPKDIDQYQQILTADGYVLCGKYNYDIRNIPYGTPIRFYSNGRKTGLFYCDTVERKGKDLFQINCISAIGMMNRQRHHGNIYTGQTFATVLAEIIGDEYEYEIESDVASVQVFGWLPYSTRRRNLHQLLVAYGVTITKSDVGVMLFNFIKAVDSFDIPSNRVFDGGSVQYGEPASRVEITEHAYHYLPTVEFISLFDTQGESVENSIVTFEQPIYADTLKVDEEGTLEIKSRGTNYAVVSGAGILYGQPYVHTTKLLTKDNEEAQTEKIVTVDEATLITMANSDNCLARISNYYFNATIVTQDIKVEDERTGRRYVVENPFHEYSVGFLSRMSINTSSFRRAECDFITNYTPMAQGTSFGRRDIIEPTVETQTWTVPDSVYEKDIQSIRVALIGKGGTGQNGTDGEAGEKATGDSGGKGGKGGKGGEGGRGGKILTMTLDCSNIAFLTYGKDSNGNVWISIGDDYYSSATGASSSTGFVEIFSGAVLALPGVSGYDGASGGTGGTNPPIGTMAKDAENGEDLVVDGVTYQGGKASARKTEPGSRFPAIHDNLNLMFGGAGGGGAAYGANGQNATAGAIAVGDSWLLATGGAGANAVPFPETAQLYGAGGNGGSGGGGGGGAATLHYWNWAYSTLIHTGTRDPGEGGKGSNGSEGADGCLIIYY